MAGLLEQADRSEKPLEARWQTGWRNDGHTFVRLWRTRRCIPQPKSANIMTTTRHLYPTAGGGPKYYEQNGWIYEMNGHAAFYIQNDWVYTASGQTAFWI